MNMWQVSIFSYNFSQLNSASSMTLSMSKILFSVERTIGVKHMMWADRMPQNNNLTSCFQQFRRRSGSEVIKQIHF